MSDLIFRPNTYDQSIWEDNTIRNAYRLPETLPEGAIVIDVGCHIGSFSYEAAKRGAKKVFSFEPAISNYVTAKHNLKEYIDSGVVELFNLAVWGKDDEELIIKSGQEINTGGYSVFDNWCEAKKALNVVKTVSLDTIIRDYARSESIYLLKLDCEGSEYQTIYESKKFDQFIKKIIGETHDGEFGNSEDLFHYLIKKGYGILDFNHSEEAKLGFIEAIKGL